MFKERYKNHTDFDTQIHPGREPPDGKGKTTSNYNVYTIDGRTVCIVD